MSKNPQTLANLKEAERIKQSPYKTKIHANPPMKLEIDAMLDKGIALRTIHRDMKRKYGEAMPSLSTFSNYIKMHYVPQHSVTVPKQGAAAMKDFDALLKLRNEIEDIDARIQKFAEKENVTGFPIEAVRKYRELKVIALEKYITLAIKLGVIDGMLPAEVNNYGMVNTGTIVALDEPALLNDDELIQLDNMIAFQQEQQELAAMSAKYVPDEDDPNVTFSVIQKHDPDMMAEMDAIHEKYIKRVESNKAKRRSSAVT